MLSAIACSKRMYLFIEDAASQGVQVLCFQEVFTQPYFCPGQDRKWYAAAEKIPDGHTTRLMQEYAKKYSMVIVVPIYEEHHSRRLFQHGGRHRCRRQSYLGKYRKNSYSAGRPRVLRKVLSSSPATLGWPGVRNGLRESRRLYLLRPAFSQEGWRALALNGAEYIVNPSATVAGLSKYLWELEQPASAAANGVFIGAINRVGAEEPWATTHNMGEFYGSSYIVNPRGAIEAQASYGDDELLVHEIDLDMVREVRDTWQFFRDRRPETYGPLTD